MEQSFGRMKNNYSTTQDDVKALKIRMSQGTKGVSWSNEVKQIVNAIKKKYKIYFFFF